MSMELREIPPLPFDPEVTAAAQWLDQLPAGNPVEAGRVLFPVVYSLRLHPIEARRRFELLETFQPTVFAVAHSLALRTLRKPPPLRGAHRKLADYCYKFHRQMAESYRDVIRARSFVPTFYRHERAAIVARCLENLGHAAFRLAQVYEMPPPNLWPRVAELYRYAEQEVLLDEAVAEVAPTLASPRVMHQRILLFALAAPGRLDPKSMQILFDRLVAHAGSVEWGEFPPEGRALFRFDAKRPGLPTADAAHAAPERDAHYAWAGALLDVPLPALFGPKHGQSRGLSRALARLGRPLECRQDCAGTRQEFVTGFKGVALALRYLEAKGYRSGGMDYWPRLDHVDFAPLGFGDPEPEEDGSELPPPPALTNPVDASEVEAATAEIIPAEPPGYYLVDTGPTRLRAGHLLGFRDGQAWLRLGAVRGAQWREGRLWHGVELLGTFPRLVTVRGERTSDGWRTGFVLDDRANQGGISLIVTPIHWACEQRVRVDWPRERESFRISRVLEVCPDFCHFALEGIAPQ